MNRIFDFILPYLFHYAPKRVLYWATIQAWAYATTNPYTHQTPDETSFFQVAGWLYDGRVTASGAGHNSQNTPHAI